eukprot:340346_1
MCSFLASRTSRRLIYFSTTHSSKSFFSSTKSSTSIFTNYLDKSYDNFEEKFEENDKNPLNCCKILSEYECRKLFSMNDAIRIQGEAFVSMYNKETIVPSRIVISTGHSPGDDTLFKPAANRDIVCEKVVSVRFNNPRLYNLAANVGSITLWNSDTGLTKCLMDAQFITGRRTAAASGLATDLFATSNVNVLTVFGAGTQSLEHIRSVLTVRNIPKTIYIVNLYEADALKQKLLNEITGEVNIVTISMDDFQRNQYDKYSHVISDADIICTCTNSENALFDGKLLKSNVHINAVGAYKPNMNELDENVIEQCYIFVDSKHAFHAGDLYYYFHINNDDEELNNVQKVNKTKWREIGEYITNEIGENCMNGKEFGKPIDAKYENERTLYKSVGVAAQDLHSAYFIYNNAVDYDIGTDVYL